MTSTDNPICMELIKLQSHCLDMAKMLFESLCRTCHPRIIDMSFSTFCVELTLNKIKYKSCIDCVRRAKIELNIGDEQLKPTDKAKIAIRSALFIGLCDTLLSYHKLINELILNIERISDISDKQLICYEYYRKQCLSKIRHFIRINYFKYLKNLEIEARFRVILNIFTEHNLVKTSDIRTRIRTMLLS